MRSFALGLISRIRKTFRWDRTNCFFIGRLLLWKALLSRNQVHTSHRSRGGPCLSCVLGRCQIQSRRQCPSHTRGPLAKSHHILKTHILKEKRKLTGVEGALRRTRITSTPSKSEWEKRSASLQITAIKKSSVFVYRPQLNDTHLKSYRWTLPKDAISVLEPSHCLHISITVIYCKTLKRFRLSEMLCCLQGSCLLRHV